MGDTGLIFPPIAVAGAVVLEEMVDIQVAVLDVVDF